MILLTIKAQQKLWEGFRLDLATGCIQTAAGEWLNKKKFNHLHSRYIFEIPGGHPIITTPWVAFVRNMT